tara:strand:+ start:494 stop:667 length:174 start_codon:yes stop_codon:yes gene_type:complete
VDKQSLNFSNQKPKSIRLRANKKKFFNVQMTTQLANFIKSASATGIRLSDRVRIDKD